MARIPATNRRLMMSLAKKEATYNAGVTMTSANAREMSGYDSGPPTWEDDVQSDEGEITGSEFATAQEILTKKVMIPYSVPKAKPDEVAGLGALVLGSVASVQDGGLAAYRHLITPVAQTTALPSIQVESLDGSQHAYRGVIGKKITISADEGGFIKLAADLEGSGYRVASATAFASKISESWLKATQMKVWLETGANISIDATPTQDAENISSATPDDLKTRMSKFQFEFDNAALMRYGFGSDTYQEADKGGQRKASLSFSLYMQSGGSVDDELNYYLNQDLAAIEFDAKGALIAGGGAMFYGMNLVIPATKIKKLTKAGAPGGFLTMDFEVTVLNNSVNEVVRLHVYNAQTGYMT